ncbi:MAG: beta-lactamase family protein, partial [Opitutaceae bacterium]|nr:beta-lactamase family protein [Opitutaceae bacterium]
YVADGTIAGAVFLAASGDKILACEAVGQADIASQKPMREDSIFWIASMSKPVAGTALMMLVDEGKISLDDPVSKYIPEFAAPQKIVPMDAGQLFSVTNLTGAPPDAGAAQEAGAQTASRPARQRDITVRHVLSHTSGLRFSAPDEKPTFDLLPLAKCVALYAATDLLFEPGTDYSYSNAGTNTVGRVVEIVSEMPYETFLQTRIFDPLGMRDTTFWPNEEQLPRVATSYRGDLPKRTLTPQPVHQLRYPLNDRANRHPFPGGGLFSTAGDVARLGQLLLNKGLFNGKRLLGETAVAEMTRRQTPSGKPDYGLCLLRQPGKFGHGGAYTTEFMIHPGESLVTVFMTQKIGDWGGPDGDKIIPAFEQQARELARQRAAK